MTEADRDRWNDRWAARRHNPTRRSSLIELVSPWLPPAGRALDVAGGGSGDAVRLAERGLDVTVADVSDVGLGVTRDLADEAGVAVGTTRLDLASQPLPPGPWKVITVANFLMRPLLAVLPERLEAGGVLAVVLATKTNLERSPRPPAHHLVDPNEIIDLIPSLEVLHHSEEWRRNDRHEAWLVGGLREPAARS